MMSSTILTKASVVFSLGLLLLSNTAMAQQVIPSSTDAGRISNDISKERAPNNISTPAEVSTAPEVQAPAGAANVKFVLQQVNVTGAKKLSKEKIASAYQHKIGKQISLADVYGIANNITRQYRDNGYLLSRAVVPKQDIRNGVVTIEVIEGYVSHYAISGDDKAVHNQIKAYADKLVGTGTLSAQNLERYLLLMNDLPGVKVRSVLAPSKTNFGGTDMQLIVEQRKFQGTAGVDNFGNKFIGPYRYSVGGQLNSLFGRTDQFNGAILLSPDSNELQYYTLAYTQNIDNEGTKIGLNGTYAQTNPTLPDALGGLLDPEGDSYTVGATITHPFIRSRALNLIGGAAFDITKNETNYDDPVFAPLETKDDQRVIRVTGQGNYIDGLAGYNAANVTVSQGLEIFGSSEKGDSNLSRFAGDPSFTKVAVDASRLQRVYNNFTALFAMTGQYAANSLLSSEQFGFGGSQFGRGYDFSEITGDSGLAGKVELGYTIASQQKYFTNYQPYVFYDIGKVWNRDPGAGVNGDVSAASAGAGTRITFTPSLQGDVFVAKPLTYDVTSRGDHGDDLRFKFSLTTNF